MPTPLEAATAALDREVVAALGDSFTYTPSGGSATPVVGFVDYDEDAVQYGAGSSIAQQIVIEAPVADIPVRPDANCRITGLARFSGKTYAPTGVVVSDSGFWRFALKEVVS